MADRVAFEVVYCAEYGRLHRYLWSWLGEETAEDVAQEAFTRLWRHWDEVGADKAAAWVWRVARRCAVDTYRRTHPTEELPDVAQPDDGWQERAERQIDLVRWWPTLTGEQQQALALHFGDDLSYPQIAAALGIGEVAVRRRAQRGWKALERRLYRRGRQYSREAALRGGG